MCNIERFLGFNGISRFIGSANYLMEFLTSLTHYLELDVNIICLTDEVNLIPSVACPSGKFLYSNF